HHVADEEMGPREHRVVDGPVCGCDRLSIDDTEDARASTVEVRGGGGRDRGRGPRRRFLLEGAGRRALDGEAVLAHSPDVDADDHDDVFRKNGAEGGGTTMCV